MTVQLCALSGTAQDANVVPTAPPGLEWHELGAEAKALTTRFGELSVQLLGPDDERATFVEFWLDGELAAPPLPRRGDLFFVSFHGVFELGDRDIALASASSGGSIAMRRLLLVELRSDGTAAVTADPLFRSLDFTELVASDGERLYFDLGYDGGRRKTATFDGGGLALAYTDVAPHAIPPDRCRRSFEVLTGACLHPERHPRWGAPGDAIHGPFNGATARFLLALMNHPGFQREEFLLRCAAAPQLERAPTFAAFAAAICGPEP